MAAGDSLQVRYQRALDDVNATIDKAYSLFDPVSWGRVKPAKEYRDKFATAWRLALEQADPALAELAANAMESLARSARSTLLDANGEKKVTFAEDALGVAENMDKQARDLADKLTAPLSTGFIIVTVGVALGVVVFAYALARGSGGAGGSK